MANTNNLIISLLLLGFVHLSWSRNLNASDVREGDVRVVTGQLTAKIRKRRSTDDDYDYTSNEAAEAPGLSINEIEEFPNIEIPEIPDGRSHGETIDEMFKAINPKLAEERPAASAALAGSRASQNNDELFEMDMLLTAEQKQTLFDNAGRLKKRAAISNTRYYWPQGVLPYSFMSNTFSSNDKTQIYAAMKEWQSKTCLRFEPYSESLGGRLGHQNRLMFRDGGGCSSYVGVIGRGPQPVTLARGCRIESIVSHELGHAIGLHHEQCRPDRDSYVTINERNVHRSMLYNFDKYKTSEIDSRGYAYDYTSIMHYGKTAFSNNGRITIQTKDRSKTDVIGKAKKLSSSDAGVVQKMYKCTGTVTTPKPTTRRPITDCRDTGKYCSYWKRMGQCEDNPGYMIKYCTKTCNKCTGTDACKDENKYCGAWKKAGFCKGTYEKYMSKRCAKSCGTCGSAWADMKDVWGTSMPTDSAPGSAPELTLLTLAVFFQAALFR